MVGLNTFHISEKKIRKYTEYTWRISSYDEAHIDHIGNRIISRCSVIWTYISYVTAKIRFIFSHQKHFFVCFTVTRRFEYLTKTATLLYLLCSCYRVKQFTNTTTLLPGRLMFRFRSFQFHPKRGAKHQE